MKAQDLYLKVTGKSGAQSIGRHRVWDANKFILSMQQQYSKEAEKDGSDGPFKVELSTEAEYKALHRK